MADMTTIKGKIRDTIYPNGTGSITADKHQALLLEMVDDINTNKADVEALTALEQSLRLKADKSEVASQLTELSERIDNLPKGDEFDAEGNYSSLRVGTADTAIDLAGRGESVPASFGFRASGGKSIKDGRAYIKSIKGNSVVWNQKFRMEAKTIANNGVTCTLQNDNSIQFAGQLTNAYFNFGRFPANVATHKYLFVLSGATSALNGKALSLLNRGFDATISNDYAYIFHTNSDPSKNTYIGFRGLSIGDTINETVYVNQYDLTQMFGAGNEPTTIEEFNARVATLGVDMNAYNEGEVIHCNTESIKSVGDNAWDEEWEVINGSYISSKNYIRVIPNATYYTNVALSNGIRYYDKDYNRVGSTAYAGAGQTFIVPANVQYMKFSVSSSYGTTYNHDILIRLDHSGWKNEVSPEYQPYWQDTLPLPIIRKYFPDGMKLAGSAHDEIRYNKVTQKWEMVQRIVSVDLGNYAFYKDSSKDFFKIVVDGMLVKPNYVCAKYDNIKFAELGSAKGIFLNIESTRCIISISDPSYGDDSQKFRQDLQGVMLYYELAEPIVTELDAEDQNFRDYYNVADFGTEMSQSSVPSAPFSADIIYQFNAVDMIREHELEIAELQNVIATMQAQLTSLINGGQ